MHSNMFFRCPIQLLLTREHDKGSKLRFSNHRLLFFILYRERPIDKLCLAHYVITSETFNQLGIAIVEKWDTNVHFRVYKFLMLIRIMIEKLFSIYFDITKSLKS